MEYISEIDPSVQQALGVSFSDIKLLRTALTHSSFAYETGTSEFNEKLEFLGDSVLGLAITEYIFERFPKMQEGGLAKLRANLVRAETLAGVAGDLKLGDFIFMGRGAEQSGGRRNASILADCLEAVIGAIYLDQGFDAAASFVIRLFKEKIAEQGRQKEQGDPKTTLQELTMDKWGTLPDYEIINQKGPAHRPMFSATVSIRGQVYGKGVGTSKKRAQQLAAKEALKKIGDVT
jgi:ribonuclease-3